MKKYYLVIIFLIVLFAVPMNIKADCNYSDRVRLQKLATNVSFSYHYIETQSTLIFQITVSNLTNEIYMVDQSTGKRYEANNEEFTIEGYEPDTSIRFEFYAKDKSCGDDSVHSVTVTLPFYNRFYKSSACKGAEEYQLCSKWLKHNMTSKEFSDTVLAYKNRIIPIELPDKPVDQILEWDIIIIEFWAKYYIYILSFIIIVGGYILYWYDRKTDL